MDGRTSHHGGAVPAASRRDSEHSNQDDDLRDGTLQGTVGRRPQHPCNGRGGPYDPQAQHETDEILHDSSGSSSEKRTATSCAGAHVIPDEHPAAASPPRSDGRASEREADEYEIEQFEVEEDAGHVPEPFEENTPAADVGVDIRPPSEIVEECRAKVMAADDLEAASLETVRLIALSRLAYGVVSWEVHEAVLDLACLYAERELWRQCAFHLEHARGLHKNLCEDQGRNPLADNHALAVAKQDYLTGVCLMHEGRYGDAREPLEKAQTAAESAKSANTDKLRIKLCLNIGIICREEGNTGEAMEYLTQARKLVWMTDGAKTAAEEKVLFQLAKACENPAQAVEYLHSAYVSILARLGQDSKEAGMTAAQLAFAYTKCEKQEYATEEYLDAAVIALKLHRDDKECMDELYTVQLALVSMLLDNKRASKHAVYATAKEFSQLCLDLEYREHPRVLRARVLEARAAAGAGDVLAALKLIATVFATVSCREQPPTCAYPFAKPPNKHQAHLKELIFSLLASIEDGLGAKPEDFKHFAATMSSNPVLEADFKRYRAMQSRRGTNRAWAGGGNATPAARMAGRVEQLAAEGAAKIASPFPFRNEANSPGAEQLTKGRRSTSAERPLWNSSVRLGGCRNKIVV